MISAKIVVVPNDKASCNVVFVCYAQFFIKKYGLNNINNITSTYKKVNKLLDKSVAENASFLERKCKSLR